jgi:hypothetical protein
MPIDAKPRPTREKLILTGLYLSKYDSLGLKRLGFQTFTEAFNVIGYALGAQPASIKNYRDEFDPLFPNRRKGWHKRPIRQYCIKVYEEHRHLDVFAGLIKSFLGYDENFWSGVQETDSSPDGGSQFAKRLITGLAGEQYFEAIQPNSPEFGRYAAENTTRLGCGYDFRLRLDGETNFLAVEVKGLKESTGTLSLTPKEHRAATDLGDRFFLFVVKNFQQTPFHEIFQNPLSGNLRFCKNETVTIQVAWVVYV